MVGRWGMRAQSTDHSPPTMGLAPIWKKNNHCHNFLYTVQDWVKGKVLLLHCYMHCKIWVTYFFLCPPTLTIPHICLTFLLMSLASSDGAAMSEVPVSAMAWHPPSQKGTGLPFICILLTHTSQSVLGVKQTIKLEKLLYANCLMKSLSCNIIKWRATATIQKKYTKQSQRQKTMYHQLQSVPLQ